MAYPRSTARVANAPAAYFQTSETEAWSAIGAGATVNFTFQVPRMFKPFKPVDIIVLSGIQNGLIIGYAIVTGNAPSDPGGYYTLNIPITNTTAGSLTPTGTVLIAIQE